MPTVPSGGCRDKWHCLEKPEVTLLGSFGQCQCGQALGNSRALAVRCPQSLLPNPWLLPPTRGRGRREPGGGSTRKQDTAGSPGRRRALWARHKQPAQETTAHPRPPHPPKAQGERSAKSLVPQREQGPGVNPGQGRSKKYSSPLSAPDPTWGGGEEARLARMVLPL